MYIARLLDLPRNYVSAQISLSSLVPCRLFLCPFLVLIATTPADMVTSITRCHTLPLGHAISDMLHGCRKLQGRLSRIYSTQGRVEITPLESLHILGVSWFL
jgi:hypothetical protein